jgi:hypothetical protein
MTTLALLVLAVAAAPQRAEPTVDRGATAGGCASVSVRPQPARPLRAASRGWTARRLVGLELRASPRGASRSRRIELHVLTPGGHLYQKLPAPARLPVAGTQITQRGLYGRWSVVPYVEGGLEPCGPGASFTLDP